MGVKMFLLLAAIFVACIEANLIVLDKPPPPVPCYPVFNPRPDCGREPVKGWRFWSSMQYKLFPEKLSKSQAEEFCKDWDEEVCKGEDSASNFRAHLGSYISSGEVEEALLASCEDSCIAIGDVFWLGVNKVVSGKLLYSDRRSTRRHTFPGGIPKQLEEGVDCVAMNREDGTMQITPCDQKLPFVCKIQPVSSH